MLNAVLPHGILFFSVVFGYDASIELVRLDGTTQKLLNWKIAADWIVSGDSQAGPVSVAAAELSAARFGDVTPLPRPRGPHAVLASGELIAGSVGQTNSDTLKIGNPIGQISIPLTAVAGVVLEREANPRRAAELARRFLAGDRKTDLALLKNQDMITGTLDQIGDAKITLERDGRAEPIDRELVLAIAFDPSLLDYPRTSAFHGRLALADGSVIDCLTAESVPGGLRVKTAFGGSLKIPISDLAEMSFRNGRLVYLSDIPPSKAIAEPYLDESAPHQMDRSVVATPLRAAGKTFAKGIGVRAKSRLEFPVAGFVRFQATCALDESAGEQASVRYLVETDGKNVFDSGERTANSPPVNVDAPLVNVKTLALIVDFARRGDAQDHADWLEARILRATAPKREK